MEKDYVEKITNMEKTIEAQQSEIAFKVCFVYFSYQSFRIYARRAIVFILRIWKC